MERSEILSQLNQVFADTLDNEAIRLKEDTIAADVEGWDSLAHFELVVATEKHFKIRFTSREIQNWKNVGALVDSIAAKVPA